MHALLSLQIYQSWLDKSTPYTAVRWVVTLGLSFVYMIRVYLLQVGVAEARPARVPRVVLACCVPRVRWRRGDCLARGGFSWRRPASFQAQASSGVVPGRVPLVGQPYVAPGAGAAGRGLWDGMPAIHGGFTAVGFSLVFEVGARSIL